MTSVSFPIATSSASQSKNYASWLLLFGRTGLFLLFQLLFSLGFYALGKSQAWDLGAAWWPFGVFLANVICILGMIALFNAEGKSYWDIFRIRRENVKSDLISLIIPLVITGPIAFLPNILLAGWLFGDAQVALNLLVRPLPLWAAISALVLFPVTQGFAELPLYFLGVMPRLKAQGKPGWLSVSLPALILGLQHIAIPFIPDLRFIAWRGLMFIPFAFLVGIVLHRRPRLLPYIAILHVLMDISFAVMLLNAAY